ncbi:MAG: saccharopine dehydrogenase NADP-binding domain-containing protein [Desulfobacterales bacterium]|nr:MAG: saccharopine dehydrogenase NADP-binding domain-containing protein [Desulfobacterales bacterium]
MKIAVLGGLGIQGRAAITDLSNSKIVDEVICADANLDMWENISRWVDVKKIHPIKINADETVELTRLLGQEVDVAIDLLPSFLMTNAFEAAIEAGVPMISTNYGSEIRPLHNAAMAAGIALMPECGLDPGIDLIISGHAARQFDELHVINTYCGGFPEKKACDNPLNYKISWNWDMVLRAQKRESVFIKNRQRFVVSADDQHDNEMIHRINFPGLGELEAVPNGDAVFYTDLLGITDTIQQCGRYALRWPGWCNFWRPLKKFGFLSDEPLSGLNCQVSPHQFLVNLMGPQLQYRDDEKDIVAMYNVFEGIKDGAKKSTIISLKIERDLNTGLFAMSIGVGYTASIVAQMIGRGQITQKGVLNPAIDVPYALFMTELSKRGIEAKEEIIHEA